MLKSIKKLFSLCWKPFSVNPHSSSSSSSDDGFSNSADGGKRDRNDKLLWYKELGKCSSGDFSMAVVQANQVLEDQSQIESYGGDTTFVGVYDGHGGPDTARYVCDHLYRHFREITEEAHGVTSETIRRAFLETEQGYTAIVDQLWDTRPNLATVGSCCLVGVVCQQTLYVANLGDSRAVLGRKVGNTSGVAAIQLSSEHNANMAEVRKELTELHPDDPQVVVEKHGVWRVKGIIQVSRSIGDVYLKDNKYNSDRILGKFRLPEPMQKPVLSADPAVMTLPLQPNDLFLIFASDGLWEHLSNEQAVEIVHRNPRAGSARTLLKAALQEAARKREMRYEDLRRIDKKRGSNCIQVSAGSQKARVQDKEEDICRIEEKDMREYHGDTSVSIHKDKGDLCRNPSAGRYKSAPKRRGGISVCSFILSLLMLSICFLPSTEASRSYIPVRDECLGYLSRISQHCLPFLMSVVPQMERVLEEPPPPCCQLFHLMELEESSYCLCHIVKQPYLLSGLETNLTRLFSLSGVCGLTIVKIPTSLEATCQSLPTMTDLPMIQDRERPTAVVDPPPPPPPEATRIDSPPPPPPEGGVLETVTYMLVVFLILCILVRVGKSAWRRKVPVDQIDLGTC